MIKQLLLACGLLTATTLCAFELHFPLACTLSDDCYIPYYVDHDPGPGVLDYQGGSLSYPNHLGTDIALVQQSQLQQGAEVFAVAAGKVIHTRAQARDGLDKAVHKSCGNRVVIDHGNGWQSEYCHLRQNSLRVRVHDTVSAGQVIADLGMSGQAAYPHLHLVIRHQQHVIDPFAKWLWRDPIPYQPRGLIDIGLSNNLPAVKALKFHPRKLKSLVLGQDKQMLVWARVYGATAGEKQRFTFLTPSGNVYRKVIVKAIIDPSDASYSYASYRLPKHMPEEQLGQWEVRYERQTQDHSQWEYAGELHFTLLAMQK